MQQTSPQYRRIISSINYWFETRLVIGDSGNLITEHGEQILFGGIAIAVARDNPDSGFGENRIISVETSHSLFDNNLEVGTAVAGQIDVKMFNPSGDMPRMSVVIPYVRACNDTEQSEWLQQGTYFIDTREITHNDDGLDVLTFHGYDAMLKAEQDYTDDNTLSYPATDTDIVRHIAEAMNVSVDSRTWDVMTAGINLSPVGYTMREVLAYIASMYLGWFYITDVGELRLVTMLELPQETRYLIDNIGDAIVFGSDRIIV